MKKTLFPIVLLLLFSCKKNTAVAEKKINPETAKTDSINAARMKYNDSIKTLNEKNRFADLSGSHKLSYTGDGGDLTGKIAFSKIGRDQYSISGKASSGSNSLHVEGDIKRISDKHLNFEGKISQKIGGSSYVRTKKTTFLDEGKGNYWRLQDKINADGFIDYIDIHK